MDVSIYWKETKTYSKKLTRVEKLSAGFMKRGANIADPLEKYVVAWMKRDEAAYMKHGKKTYDNVEKYLRTILDKEIKDAQNKGKGKSGMSADEIKSAKIIQSNLVLIRDELKAVLAGAKKPGNFRRDAQDDADTALYTSADQKRVQEKMTLLAKANKEAAAFGKEYKVALGKVDALLTNAKKFDKAVKASFDKQDAETNKSALSNLAGIARMANRIEQSILSHYKKNITESDTWRDVRVDVLGLDKMPKAVRKTHNDAFNKCDAAGRAVLKIHDAVKARAGAIRALLDDAEGLSIAVPDSKDALKKIADMMKTAEAIRTDIKLVAISIEGRVRAVMEMVTKPVPFERRYQLNLTQKTQSVTAIKRCEDHVKSLARIENWLAGPASRIADPAVRKASADLIAKVKEAKSFVPKFTKSRAEMLKAIKYADATLAKEKAGMTA